MPKVTGILGALARKAKKALFKKQKQRSLLLNMMPVDLMLLVIQYLQLWELMSLARTCRSMRILVGRNWEQEIRQMGGCERIRFWTHYASNLPGIWACSHCGHLHTYVQSKTAHRATAPKCRRFSISETTDYGDDLEAELDRSLKQDAEYEMMA